MNVLVIAPHPDDETLGCGGTLLKHKSAGDSLTWVIVTRGHEPHWSKEVLDRKECEIKEVGSAYGFDRVMRLDFPTVRMETIPFEEIMNQLGRALEQSSPECVYLNHAGDVHTDHRTIFDAAMSVLKPFNGGKHGVKRVLSYETLSSTEAMPAVLGRGFLPNVFSDISCHIENKLDIMARYTSEIQPYPLPRSLESIKALARVRGATIGVEYAEAFMLVREVN
jgi:LmbE family N-acetylglucosaminyl deacetylase